MVKLETKLLDVKDSNLVFLIEHKSDLNILSDLDIDTKILSKINETIKLEKNLTLSFYM
jgi:hypothetical protein